MISTCPKVEEDTRAGKCRRNVEGKVCLPSGAFVPRHIPGTTMRDRINEWHRLNPGQLAAGLLSVGNMVFEAVTSASPFTGVLQLDRQERIESLERELNALRNSAKSSEEPVRRSARQAAKSGTATEPVPSIPVAPAAPTPTPSVPTTTHPVPTQPAGPVHPYASARDAIRPRPGIAQIPRADPIPESTSKGRDSGYKTYVPAYNPKVADDVFTRSLATPSVTLTPGELLALAPEVRSKYRELVTPKRTPANANIVELTDATALAVPEGVSVHKCSPSPP